MVEPEAVRVANGGSYGERRIGKLQVDGASQVLMG